MMWMIKMKSYINFSLKSQRLCYNVIPVTLRMNHFCLFKLRCLNRWTIKIKRERIHLTERSPICFSMSAASSGVALGRMPGSEKLVCRREMTTKTKRTPPITGMQPVRCSTRKGQLETQQTWNEAKLSLVFYRQTGKASWMMKSRACRNFFVFWQTDVPSEAMADTFLTFLPDETQGLLTKTRHKALWLSDLTRVFQNSCSSV